MFRYKGYSILSLVYLVLCFIYTKIFYRKAKIIRLPFRLRKFGRFLYGRNLVTGSGCRVDIFEGGELRIGDSVQLNDRCHIACADSLVIGDGALIASNVFITDHDHDLASKITGMNLALLTAKVAIGENCWIGENVAILKGVELGNNCIVGANSVVTKSFPPNSILAGVPARKLKNRSVSD